MYERVCAHSIFATIHKFNVKVKVSGSDQATEIKAKINTQMEAFV